MAKAVQTQTPAEKRKQTRLRNKAKQQAARDHRWAMFESMSEEESNDMIERLEAIKDDYRSRMENFEEELLMDMRAEFETVYEDYSYDTIKGYLEGDFNGRETYPAFLDLEHMVDEHKDESSFEFEERLADILAKREREEGLALAKFVQAGKKLDALEQDYDGNLVPTTDQWGNKPSDEQVIEGYTSPEDFIERNGLERPRKQAPSIPTYELDEIRELKQVMCGVCGRPWLDGKCSGGFINHKL